MNFRILWTQHPLNPLQLYCRALLRLASFNRRQR